MLKYSRAVGLPEFDIGCQVSEMGLYLPPVLVRFAMNRPPQTSTSLPLHTSWVCSRLDGAPIVVMGVHVSVTGSYRNPGSGPLRLSPPQTTNTDPVHTPGADVATV